MPQFAPPYQQSCGWQEAGASIPLESITLHWSIVYSGSSVQCALQCSVVCCCTVYIAVKQSVVQSRAVHCSVEKYSSLYSVQHTAYSVQSTVYSVKCKVYSAQCMWPSERQSLGVDIPVSTAISAAILFSIYDPLPAFKQNLVSKS